MPDGNVGGGEDRPPITAGGCPAGPKLRRPGRCGGCRRPLTRQEVPWQRATSRPSSGRATGRKSSRPRCFRSSGSSARARSCARRGDEGAGRGDPDRVDRAGRGARPRRPAAWPHRRDILNRVVRQNYSGAARRGQRAEGGRHRGVHRHRARAGPGVRQEAGLDTDAMLVSQPDTGEQALEIADMLIRSGALDIIVIDSVAALVPKAEIEGEMETATSDSRRGSCPRPCARSPARSARPRPP